MNRSEKILGLITSIGIAVPLIFRAIDIYLLVFVKIGEVFTLVIHYFLYVGNLGAISLIFGEFILQPNKKDTQKYWALFPSILIPWVISWDFAFPSTTLPTLTLLKSIFYLLIFIRFSRHILNSSDWIVTDRTIYNVLLIFAIINFVGENLIENRMSIGGIDTLASLLISRASMSFLAGILMVAGIFYTNSFLQNKLDKDYLKIIPYLPLALSVLSLFLSILVFYQNTYPYIISWGYSVDFDLPNSPFAISHFILFLYLLTLPYINQTKARAIEQILALSFTLLFIGLNTEDIFMAGEQAIEFIQGDLGTYGVIISSAVGAIGIISTVIGLFRRETVKDKKEVTSL